MLPPHVKDKPLLKNWMFLSKRMEIGFIVLKLSLMLSDAYAISADCTHVRLLASGLKMQNQAPNIWTELQGDCCNSTISAGIICDLTPRVTSIIWSSLSLNGTIDNSPISTLTYLKHLDLSRNKITGTIPVHLPNSLTYIDLSLNFLNGSIPDSLPSNLTTIWFNKNALTGEIPNILPYELQNLYLYGNQLSGSIPFSLPSELIKLHLYDNKLNGTIPLSVSSLAFLTEFKIGDEGSKGNFISGKIPNSLPITLTSLFLSNNRLNGPFPSLHEIAGLTDLKLQHNQLFGQIPSLPLNLKWTDLSNNEFNGTIPGPLPPTLVNLYLNNNRFTGELPKLPTSLTILWTFGGNKFSGSIELNRPLQLYISDNLFTNVFVADISNLNTGCDISRNPLLGNFNITNLNLCAQIGLYSPWASTIIVDSTTLLATRSTTFTTFSESMLPILAWTSIHENSLETNPTSQKDNPILYQFDPTILIISASVFVGICILLCIARKVFKDPKINGRFQRKHSYGTLNTIASKKVT